MHTSGTSDERHLITRDEAARLLAVSEDMIRKMQRTGRLSLVKVGACARVRYSEIVAITGGYDQERAEQAYLERQRRKELIARARDLVSPRNRRLL